MALEIEVVLFAYYGAGRDGAATENVGHMVGYFLVVVADVVGLAHQVDA